MQGTALLTEAGKVCIGCGAPIISKKRNSRALRCVTCQYVRTIEIAKAHYHRISPVGLYQYKKITIHCAICGEPRTISANSRRTTLCLKHQAERIRDRIAKQKTKRNETPKPFMRTCLRTGCGVTFLVNCVGSARQKFCCSRACSQWCRANGMQKPVYDAEVAREKTKRRKPTYRRIDLKHSSTAQFEMMVTQILRGEAILTI